MLTVLGIIFIAVIAFVALGLLGWLGQAIAWIAKFLGDGITGCMGCSVGAIWYIIVVIFFMIVLFGLL
jgi:hypothetical protein